MAKPSPSKKPAPKRPAASTTAKATAKKVASTSGRNAGAGEPASASPAASAARPNGALPHGGAAASKPSRARTADASGETETQAAPGTAPSPAVSESGRPVPPRPSRPPAPITGTAAMKTLAQRNAAALRPPTDPADLSSEAQRILATGDTAAIAAIGEAIAAERSIPQNCKTLDDVLASRPELLVGLVDRFAVLVASPQKRTVQTVALALPVMARMAPAKVARHLQPLTERFASCSEVGKDGLVSTFAALCMASVAYQKRLEPVLELALSSADPRALQRWAEIILPSLKGEPHARARAVVEGRLPSMPRPLAQPIAGFLGIKLRPVSA